MRSGILVLVTAAVTQVACYDPHAHDSAIVRQIEANGSGDISTYTMPGLVAWFQQRPALATAIAAECRPVSLTANANWITSAEGTACRAAIVTAPPPEFKADSRTW
jgi:hypothetical protein